MPVRRRSGSWTTTRRWSRGRDRPGAPGEGLWQEFLEPLEVTQHRLGVEIGMRPRRMKLFMLGMVTAAKIANIATVTASSTKVKPFSFGAPVPMPALRLDFYRMHVKPAEDATLSASDGRQPAGDRRPCAAVAWANET